MVGGPHARTSVVGAKAVPSRLSVTRDQPRQVIGSDSATISLSAVSEAPISRQVVESRWSGGALQIQRLEGSRPSREPMGFV